MKQNIIFFGSCRMDKGEGLQYITDAVERAAKQKPVAAFFDIVCKPGSEAQGASLLVHFYQLATRHFKKCPSNQIFGGVTSNLEIRPAAMALFLVNEKTGSHPAFKDINPGREGNWKA